MAATLHQSRLRLLAAWCFSNGVSSPGERVSSSSWSWLSIFYACPPRVDGIIINSGQQPAFFGACQFEFSPADLARLAIGRTMSEFANQQQQQQWQLLLLRAFPFTV
uniref:Putative secreted protein n=1 Tax=Anopheles triannulatus TaxID=58253 RepID=A0A2M4B4I7_9DIPT